MMGDIQHPHQFGPAVNPPAIPPVLHSGCWCVWYAVPKPNKPGKFDKIPSNGFSNLSPYKLEEWLTFENALAMYQNMSGHFNGIGKLILPMDNISVIDIDGVDPAFVQKWTTTWPTYWERSPSGQGLRGVSIGRARRDISKPIEVYAGHGSRFVTFTGDVVSNQAPIDLTQQINAYIEQYAGTNTMMSELPEMPELVDVLNQDLITYPPGTDRSDFNFKTAFQLLINGATPQYVFSLLMQSPEVYDMALEHRPRSDDQAQYQAICEYLWRDVCKAEAAAQKERDAHLTVFQDVSQQNNAYTAEAPACGGDPLGWLDAYSASDEDMDAIGQEVFLYPDLVIKSHLLVVPAPPESGKTTVFMMIARYIAQQGYIVDYINADCPAPHAKDYHFRAKREGFRMRLPDYTHGGSMDKIVEGLKWTAAQPNVDLSDRVLIFDTLKKMTDVIRKSEAKDLFNTLRALTAKGATIICLAHTNKYRVDGEHIFEGTGDIKSDSDDLVYFEALPDDSRGRRHRTITVSTRLDKFRGIAEPISFFIDDQRQVSQLPEYVNVSQEVEANMHRGDDQSLIDAILLELNQVTEIIQSELVRRVQETEGAGRPRVTSVLSRYAGQLWVRDRQVEHNNRVVYRAMEQD